jgi:hypothetical protein
VRGRLLTEDGRAKGRAARSVRAAEERRHGTLAMYRTEECRCEACREAMAYRQRVLRARRGDESTASPNGRRIWKVGWTP